MEKSFFIEVKNKLNTEELKKYKRTSRKNFEMS